MDEIQRLNAEILSLQDKLKDRDALILTQCELIADLSHRIQTDALTGIYNRAGISNRLDSMISQHERMGSCVFVAFIDIDDFKTVNDTWGHEAGDIVLQTVADRLRASTRMHDIVGRWSGDEFVVAFSLSKEEIERNLHMTIVNRISTAIRGTTIEYNDFQISITVSIGVFGYCGAEHVTPSQLVAMADKKMYVAKQAGKNTVTTEVELGNIQED